MDEIREGIVNAETEAGNIPCESDCAVPEQQNNEGAENVADTQYAEPEERKFTLFQTVFAWVCWLSGYLLCRIFPLISSPLGGFLFVPALFAVTAVLLKKQGAVFGKMSVLAAVASIAVLATLVLSSNETLQQVSFLFSLCSYGYFVYSATGNSLQKGFSDFILVDYFKALVVLPFCTFGQMFKAMFHGKASSGGRVFGKTVLGLVIAVVPTVIVIALLSYDADFSKILSNIFDFEFLDIFSHLLSIGFGIPIGMYIFGLYLSSSNGNRAEYINAPTMSKISAEMKRMPNITAFAAALPLLLVYVVFFISQWKYYVSGFTGVLPDDESYANYAREGFFQLCTVSVINLIAIIVLSAFLRRKEDGTSSLLKLLSVVFSVFTLVLISTAIAKMVMYIDHFGLTPKRVYASWFMLLLAVIFILVIVKQFVQRFKVIIASLGISVVLFAVLSICNVDGIIARYNINRYLDGSLKTVDVGALYELGDAAVPEMVYLAYELDDRLGTDISESVVKYDRNFNNGQDEAVYSNVVTHLKFSANRLNKGDDGVFSYTVQKYRAESALRKIGALE